MIENLGGSTVVIPEYPQKLDGTFWESLLFTILPVTK